MSSLVIGLPSKGRLQESSFDYFRDAGLKVSRPGGARNYRGRISSLPGAEITFLSASEIAGELARGNIHIGITGEDLLHEKVPGFGEKIQIMDRPGFGHADVVVAVPDAWIDVRTMADLADVAYEILQNSGRQMRVATKYISTTQRYFAEHGVTDYRIVESLGATEGTPAAGTADIITDITTTGSTLRANALRALDVAPILRSEATLSASLTAPWSGEATATVAELLSRISARAAGRRFTEAEISGVGAGAALQSLGDSCGQVSILEDRENACRILLQRKHSFNAVAALKQAGAEQVSLRDSSFIFMEEEPLFKELYERIKRLPQS